MDDARPTPGANGEVGSIDAVITWVDGEDPQHAAKRARYLQDGRTDGVHQDALAATRFADRGEIGFAVRSILRFCPFVRRLHIVTDGQYPACLERILSEHPEWRGRVRIVDHRAIYGEHADLLPVFSSRSVETMIHRIPGLAEHFVYLNDDMVVGRPLDREYFFRAGAPVLRGTMRRFPNAMIRWLKPLRPGPRRAGFNEAQRAAARLVGRRRDCLLVGHHPHAMRRSTLADFFATRPELLREQAGHRFRSSEQVSPIGLANHLELARGAPVEPAGDVGYVKPPRTNRNRAAIRATLAALEQGALASLCIQSLDAMVEDDRRMVLASLARTYGAVQTPG